MLWLCIHLPQLRHESQAANAVEAIERLAAWCYQWSSQVNYRLEQSNASALLWVEIGASRELFGGHGVLLKRIDSGLTDLGYTHVCALAPSPLGAALLTRVQRQRCVFTPAQLRMRLEPLSLTLLDMAPEIGYALQSAGLQRIGQILALPPAALARRFGPQLTLYLRRLLGQASDPRPAWQLPPVWRARCEFGCELRDTTALLFPLQRLLQEFQGYLRGRDCSVLRFTLRLEHHQRPASDLAIGLSAPARDAALFLQLARERLHQLVLPAPVLGLQLEALEFTAPSIVQQDFFGSPAEQLQQFQLLLDRLRARLGNEQVQGLAATADHRPERAWQMSRQIASTRSISALSASSPSTSTPTPPGTSRRPCFLKLDPQPIPPPPHLLSGPERIESGWWDRADVIRDYYVARGEDGARLWVFRDLSDGSWYLQGLWS
jgi:protein ImuB